MQPHAKQTTWRPINLLKIAQSNVIDNSEFIHLEYLSTSSCIHGTYEWKYCKSRILLLKWNHLKWNVMQYSTALSPLHHQPQYVIYDGLFSLAAMCIHSNFLVRITKVIPWIYSHHACINDSPENYYYIIGNQPPTICPINGQQLSTTMLMDNGLLLIYD